MLKTTVGQLVLQSAFPEGVWKPGTVMDKKGAEKVLAQMAESHPEKYRETLYELSQIGQIVSTRTGGNSFGLRHLRTAESTKLARYNIQKGLERIRQRADLSPEEKQQEIEKLADHFGDKLTEDLYQESLAEKNPLAYQVLSGSRGNKSNLRSLRGFDVAYQDDKERRIPVPILHNYGEGLTPAEYWSGTYGARHGVTSTKLATAEGGYFLKQLTQATHRLITTQLDGEDDGNPYRRGLPVDTDDADNVGALLAVEHGPYKRNTVLTPKILSDLRRQGFDQLLVRSPTVGGPQDGGVYSRDVGVREHGNLPGRGEWVGLPAAQALGERLTQGSLGAKHSGGVVNTGPSGFELVNALAQAPEIFPGGAVHAEDDGEISQIRPAPQGGQYITINGKEIYAPAEVELKVKLGQKVEAGDVLTSGIPRPDAIVKHKGLGEGRKYLTQALRDAYKSSGMPAHRRNVELVARGLLDHVRMTDLWEDYAPDDIVPYHTIEGSWKPRQGMEIKLAKSSVGKYLEQPVLHYTVGTKIRQSMLPTLEKFGVHSLPVHNDPPPFEPELQRAAAIVSHDPDPFVRLLGSNQKASLLEGAHRGLVSDFDSTSYVPALAAGKPFGNLK